MDRSVIRRVRIVALVGGVCLLSAHLGVSSTNAVTLPPNSPFAGVTPNWDKKLPSSSRFTVLSDFNNEAVRDNETGLVWESAPLVTGFTWFQAIGHCAETKVGGRMGWHLPTVEQMASLLDPTVSGSPKLSPGHPFQVPPGVSSCCWTATQFPGNSTLAYTVDISIAGSAGGLKVGALFSWCVRGGQSFDGNAP